MMKPLRFYDAKSMAKADRFTIEKIKIPSIVLMENAASLFTQVLMNLEKDLEKKKILVVAGKGNNGGDALAVSRRLLNYVDIKNLLIFTFGKKEEYKPDAKRQLEILSNLGALIFNLKEISLDEFKKYLNQIDILIDGIFGTGLERSVEGFYKDVINIINKKKCEKNFKVYAVDLPSGISASSPVPIGDAIRADISVTFAGPKVAHLFPDTKIFTGKTYVADISIPNFIDYEEISNNFLMERAFIKEIYPPLSEKTHKYQQGFLGILGGSPGKTGAVVLAALASLKVGLGLTSVCVPKSLNFIFETKLTEEMSTPIEDKGNGYFGPYSLEDYERNILNYKFDALVLGPGLGLNEKTKIFVKKVLETWQKPILIDADGINNLAFYPEILKERKVPAILTPHFGEFLRVGKNFLESYYSSYTPDQIKKEILKIGKEFAKEYNVVLVFKDVRTLIFSPQGEVFINVDAKSYLPFIKELEFLGNPGMATAGSGDVLAGLIGGYLARLSKIQKCPVLEAALLGVYIHGLAGNLATLDIDPESLKASDIIKYISNAIRLLKSNSNC